MQLFQFLQPHMGALMSPLISLSTKRNPLSTLGTVPGFLRRLISLKQLQRGTPLSITVIRNKFN